MSLNSFGTYVLHKFNEDAFATHWPLSKYSRICSKYFFLLSTVVLQTKEKISSILITATDIRDDPLF
jgi:hypothetical protein